MLGFHLKIFLFSLLFVGVAYLVPQYKPWEHPWYVSQSTWAPYLCLRGSVPLYVTKYGLAPPAAWKSLNFSEQLEKEALQRALHLANIIC